jgi:hypothetical protein
MPAAAAGQSRGGHASVHDDHHDGTNFVAIGGASSGWFETEEIVAARSSHPLTGSVEELHAAIDALDTDTVPESYTRRSCQPNGHTWGT